MWPMYLLLCFFDAKLVPKTGETSELPGAPPLDPTRYYPGVGSQIGLGEDLPLGFWNWTHVSIPILAQNIDPSLYLKSKFPAKFAQIFQIFP